MYSLHPERTAADSVAVVAQSLQGNALLSSAEPLRHPALQRMLCRYENRLLQAAGVPKPVQANIVVMGQDEFHDALESAAESASIASTSSDRQLESGQQASAAFMYNHDHIFAQHDRGDDKSMLFHDRQAGTKACLALHTPGQRIV